MDKIISASAAAQMIKSGTRLLVGGFLCVGAPELIIENILKMEINNLFLISADTGFSDCSVGKLISAKRVSKLISTHVGANKSTVEQINAGEIEYELIPQGTFTRRLHCAGSGIGGFLTKVGMGTEVETGKRKIEVDGEEFLLELPLAGDVAIIGAAKVDKYGNCYLEGTGKNYNDVIAMAAKTVIVEADEIFECGQLDPNAIDIPGVYIDHIVIGKGKK